MKIFSLSAFASAFALATSAAMRFSFLTSESQPIKVPMEATKIMIEAKALISGDRPRLMEEKISIGNVVDSGPAIKLVITTSSIDIVNDSKKAAISAGMSEGNITEKNTFKGPAPKSLAASSMDVSSSKKRERITTVAYAEQKVTCANHMAAIPLSAKIGMKSPKVT